MDAHIKNVEASTADGKFDPGAGLVKVKLKLLNSFVKAGINDVNQ